MKPVIYVIVNKGLHMSAGKLAAQVGHAVARVMLDATLAQWRTAPHRWLIVLEGRDDIHLQHIREYLEERNVRSTLVIDEGANEIPSLTATALGVQILDKDSEQAGLLSGLKRYSDDLSTKVTNAYDHGFAKGVESRRWRFC